jgi:hypothetical protein
MATKRTYAENLALVAIRVGAAKKAAPKAPAAAKQLILPMWPDAVRGVPNAFIRSALFGVSNTRKVHQKRTIIAAVDGYVVRFKGESFNQTDLDLWKMLTHLARLQPLGTKVEFTAHAMLKELGRGTGGKDHADLAEQLMRLIGGVVEVTWTKEKKAFAEALLSSYVRDDETGRYVVTFSEKMSALFDSDYTLIDLEQRLALGKNNLAKYLLDIYASHAKPYPYKVETLRELSNSTAALKSFKQSLKKALDALKAVGAILSWSIDDCDLVHVVRSPSDTQKRHLAKKTTKKKIAVIAKKLGI